MTKKNVTNFTGYRSRYRAEDIILTIAGLPIHVELIALDIAGGHQGGLTCLGAKVHNNNTVVQVPVIYETDRSAYGAARGWIQMTALVEAVDRWIAAEWPQVQEFAAEEHQA